jgi:phosphoribosylformylglycinamidine cyclo-ligase
LRNSLDDTASRVIKGIAQGCEQGGCALIGGETAEMPGMYTGGEYDLAGFAVGVVEKSSVIDGAHIRSGDVVLGLASNGAHANGYSLVRKVIEAARIDLGSAAVDGQALADLVLAPTRIYVKPVLRLLRELPVKGLAHITGGGLVENVPRVLPETLTARIDRAGWPRSALFSWLQQRGNIPEAEMLRVFNCGIGMVLIVDRADADRAADILCGAGETVYRIGAVDERKGDEPHTIVA